MNKGQAMALNIHVLSTIDLCLDSDYLHCEKKLNPYIHLALVDLMADWKAGRQTKRDEFQNF